LVTRALALTQPTDDGAAIARAALRLLARVVPWEPVRLVGVAVTRLVPSDGTQLALTFGGETEQRRSRLNAAVDTIHARFGDEALRRGTADLRRAGLSIGIKRGEE
jgi:DNA polymerase-4